jgi:hypothetical protein
LQLNTLGIIERGFVEVPSYHHDSHRYLKIKNDEIFLCAIICFCVADYDSYFYFDGMPVATFIAVAAIFWEWVCGAVWAWVVRADRQRRR